jgi:SNF2 family DNA or RNA helicase
MAKVYGATPWGAWFIDVLDSYKMGARLDRGRSYANTGKVLSLDFKNGRAVARVRGNYKPFYIVEIQFPVLKESAKIFRLIEDDPALLARIAAGDLPEEFLVKLKSAGINLIPKTWSSMKRSCTCPDWGDPCKHMAALYYIIAAEIDADPRLLFRLRSVDLEKRFGRSLSFSLPTPFTIDAAVPGPVGKASGEPPLLDEIPYCAELISSLLPARPIFSSRDFAFTMAEFYHHGARLGLLQEPAGGEGDNIAEYKERRFSRSSWRLICPEPGPGAEVFLEEIDVLGEKREHSVFDAYEDFIKFSESCGTASYIFLLYLFRFLNMVVRSCAFIPYVFLKNGMVKIVWKPYEALPQISRALDGIAALECGLLALKNRKKSFASGYGVTDLVSSAFLNEWVRRTYFQYKPEPGSREHEALLDLFFHKKEIDVSSPAMRSLPVSIDRWLSVLHIGFTPDGSEKGKGPSWEYRFIVKTAGKAGKKKADSPGARGIPEADDQIFFLSLDLLFATETGTARKALSKAVKTGLSKDQPIDTQSILRAPTALSNYLPEIRVLMTGLKVELSEKRLAFFLESAAPLLKRLGIGVELPRTLSKELKPRLVLKIAAKGTGALVSYLGLDSLLEWKWQVAIGDKLMSIGEFEKLLKEKRDLVRLKDGFVRIDAEELAKLLRQAKGPKPEVNDFLKAHFAGDSVVSFDAEQIIRKLFEERSFAPPRMLKADLRPYQKRGYNWVCSLLLAGFGCVLADDMGLGKTIQSIAVILRLKTEGLLGRGCLVVAPAALLENWEKELSRFAPSLKVSRYHGTGRRLVSGFDVFLTTYQTAVRDAVKLEKRDFSLLVVDEAHLMKNSSAAMSRTVKTLRSQYRLALSGTPVENRLEDLRSLFDFILPGYLGGPTEFRSEFRYPIEVLRNGEKAEALRKITAPFLLRRLKTDRTIIKDLPDKIIANEYAVLEKEQAALYESVVSESIKQSAVVDEPVLRSALILKLLTALKQICDHPRVFDKQSPAVSGLSGKAQLLMTLVEELLRGGEKVLVFSQYVETLDCLSRIIAAELGEKSLVYHGGMGQKKRGAVIERFQTDPSARLLLVSLKAGGLGLNLTAASRVIHYDLWYNPAVENQATDRAFRIGQKRNVFVYRFITKNTFEEKIDAMLSSKRELADLTVSSGESWLARMSHEELRELFNR